MISIIGVIGRTESIIHLWKIKFGIIQNLIIKTVPNFDITFDISCELILPKRTDGIVSYFKELIV